LQWKRIAKTWKSLITLQEYPIRLCECIYQRGLALLVNEDIVDYGDGRRTWKKYKLVAVWVPAQAAGNFSQLYSIMSKEVCSAGKNELRLDGTRATYVYNKGFDGKITSENAGHQKPADPWREPFHLRIL